MKRNFNYLKKLSEAKGQNKVLLHEKMMGRSYNKRDKDLSLGLEGMI